MLTSDVFKADPEIFVGLEHFVVVRDDFPFILYLRVFGLMHFKICVRYGGAESFYVVTESYYVLCSDPIWRFFAKIGNVTFELNGTKHFVVDLKFGDLT